VSQVFLSVLMFFVFSFVPGIAGGALPGGGHAAGDSVSKLPPQLEQAGIVEKLGAQISLDQLQFKDETGKSVSLGSYFRQGRPVVLNLVYYECPSLCSMVLNGFLDSLKQLPWVPGQEFDIVTLSIDHREGPELAASKKARYLEVLGKPGADKGWHFLTGDENQIKTLATEVGFGYTYDEKEKQYAHAAGIFVLTPGGQLSRILYGIEYKSRDLRLALTEAGEGKIGTVVDRFLLFCYRYDPNLRSYSVYLFNVMRAAAVVTVLVMAMAFGVVWLKQKQANLRENT
jgi:protein SCO1/2